MDSSLDWNGIWSAKVVGVMGHMLPGKEESVGKDTTIAVDLTKSIFEVAVSTRPGVIAKRHRLSRTGLVGFSSTLPPATVLLEACGTVHWEQRGGWARSPCAARSTCACC
jgi:hypothetical protein